MKEQLQKSDTELKNLELKLANCFKEKDEQIIAIKKIYEIQMKISEADLLRQKCSHEKSIATLNAQIENINTELGITQNENVEGNKIIRDQYKRFSSLENKYINRGKELEQLQSENQTLKKKIQVLSGEQTELNKKLTEFQKRYIDLENRDEKAMGAYKSNEAFLVKEKKDLESRLNEQIKAKLTLNNELKNLKDNNIKLEDINSKNLNKIADLELELMKYENEFKSELFKKDAHIRQIENNFDHFESSNQLLTKMLNDKYSEYEALKNSRELLAKNLIQTQEELKSVLKEFKQSQAENKKIIQQIQDEKSRLESDLRQSIDKLRVLELDKAWLELELNEKNQIIKTFELQKDSNSPNISPEFDTKKNTISVCQTLNNDSNTEQESIFYSKQVTLDDLLNTPFCFYGNL